MLVLKTDDLKPAFIQLWIRGIPANVPKSCHQIFSGILPVTTSVLFILFPPDTFDLSFNTLDLIFSSKLHMDIVLKSQMTRFITTNGSPSPSTPYYDLNVHVSPNSYVKALIPNVTVLGDGAIGKYLGHEGGTLRKGICALIKEAPESSPDPFPHVRIQESATPKWAFTNHAGTPIADSSLQNRETYISVVYKPLSLWDFVIAA